MAYRFHYQSQARMLPGLRMGIFTIKSLISNDTTQILDHLDKEIRYLAFWKKKDKISWAQVTEIQNSVVAKNHKG